MKETTLDDGFQKEIPELIRNKNNFRNSYTPFNFIAFEVLKHRPLFTDYFSDVELQATRGAIPTERIKSGLLPQITVKYENIT